MKILDINSENIREAVKVLEGGGVVAHPADTCYGFAADLMNEQALRRLQAIKGRDADKPMSIMLPASMKGIINHYASSDAPVWSLCQKLFPGPVTVVVQKGSKVPSYFFPNIDTVGIRIPNDELTQNILEAFGGPLITTSANPSGVAPFSGSNEVLTAFANHEDQPDLMFQGRIDGECMPSTILRPTNDGIEILREGPISKAEIERILGLGA